MNSTTFPQLFGIRWQRENWPHGQYAEQDAPIRWGLPAYNDFDAGHCQNNYDTRKEFVSIVNLLDMFANQCHCIHHPVRYHMSGILFWFMVYIQGIICGKNYTTRYWLSYNHNVIMLVWLLLTLPYLSHVNYSAPEPHNEQRGLLGDLLGIFASCWDDEDKDGGFAST